MVSSINCALLSGIIKSSFPKEIPALNACLKPKSLSLSQKITVLFWPVNLKTWSIISETTFLGKTLSIKENPVSLFFGKRFASKNLPAVLVCFSNFWFPFSSIVSNREIILEWIFILPDSKPCSISELFTKYPSIFFSW